MLDMSSYGVVITFPNNYITDDNELRQHLANELHKLACELVLNDCNHNIVNREIPSPLGQLTTKFSEHVLILGRVFDIGPPPADDVVKKALEGKQVAVDRIARAANKPSSMRPSDTASPYDASGAAPRFNGIHRRRNKRGGR